MVRAAAVPHSTKEGTLASHGRQLQNGGSLRAGSSAIEPLSAAFQKGCLQLCHQRLLASDQMPKAEAGSAAPRRKHEAEA